MPDGLGRARKKRALGFDTNYVGLRVAVHATMGFSEYETGETSGIGNTGGSTHIDSQQTERPPAVPAPGGAVSNNPEALYRSGVDAAQAGRLAEADRCFSQAVALRPSEPVFQCALGLLRTAQGRFADGLTCHDKALAIDAAHLGALAGRADALHELGRLVEAEAAYRHASALAPHAPELRFGWATVLSDLGRLEEAAQAYRDVLVLSPRAAEAYVDLGIALRDLGRLDEAAAQFEAALVLKPDVAHAGIELVSAFCDLGRSREAVQRAAQVMRRDPRSSEASRAFAIAVSRSGPLDYTAENAGFLERCLASDDVDHDALARPCARQVRQKHRIDPSPVEAARGAVDAAARGSGIPPCLTDPLLLKLLATTVNTDLELERFLTEARRQLSLAPTLPAGLNPFLAALALQCFNNGYAFATSAEEDTCVAALRSSIEDELSHTAVLKSILEQKLLRFALYEPLTALTPAKRLLELLIPSGSPLGAVVTHCLTEPLEEAALARKLPSLGPIENAVSQAVRDQYEEHPYPRWLSLPRLAPVSFSAMLRRSIPHVQPPSFDGPIEVLIAGCGTGRQPIATALSLAQARVLAVDLSLKSLGYAKRMAVRLGASNVEFLHADLLALGRLGREFHVVEAVGVLHHMQDPLAGWRILCRLLRPGGFMRIGLYSALARSEVTVARERIANLGLTPAPRDVRAFRRRVLLGDEHERLPGLALSKDIYDLNGCRDLIFHTRERCYTIPEVQAILQGLGLEFLGFEFAENGAARRYRAENPDDPSTADLARWARFETSHPDTFSGMYVFWCRKPESGANS